MISHSSLDEEKRGRLGIEIHHAPMAFDPADSAFNKAFKKKFILVDGKINYKFNLQEVIDRICPPYQIGEPEGGYKKEFTEEEKRKLRPIAETLAMLDSNAFFTQDVNGKEWYEMYLPDAHALYEGNGGDTGWACETSIYRKRNV